MPTESGRLVFQLWLALFFYDLATYLTPGWLTHDIKCPQISVDTSDNTSSLLSSPITQASENRHQDISKSSLSLNHLFGELLAPETLEEIEEIRKLSYTLADQIIDKLIKTASHYRNNSTVSMETELIVTVNPSSFMEIMGKKYAFGLNILKLNITSENKVMPIAYNDYT
ncbi:Ras-associating and dilute domain-containing protein [Schistosoma japonicum]|nr:Ras-associating and dilute domain-containing protein [Schistosoma japonicum]